MFETQQLETLRDRSGGALASASQVAAALAACGFVTRYKKVQIPDEADRIEHTWFCDSRAQEANQLLNSARLITGPHALQTTAPEHPFLAGIYAVRNLQELVWWFQSPAHPPAAAKPSAAGRLCFLHQSIKSIPSIQSTDLIPIQWATTKPAHHIDIPGEIELAFAAAAVTCGFLPHPQLTGATHPRIAFPDASLTFEALRLDDFLSPEIPGSPQQQRHPFCFAVTACRYWLRYDQIEQTIRDRTYFVRSEFSERTAYIGSHILDEPGKEFADAREEYYDHLAAA